MFVIMKTRAFVVMHNCLHGLYRLGTDEEQELQFIATRRLLYCNNPS